MDMNIKEALSQYYTYYVVEFDECRNPIKMYDIEKPDFDKPVVLKKTCENGYFAGLYRKNTKTGMVSMIESLYV